jgi:hypothetical protein
VTDLKNTLPARFSHRKIWMPRANIHKDSPSLQTITPQACAQNVPERVHAARRRGVRDATPVDRGKNLV